MDKQKIYSEAATHALAGFQIIEESLKDYITAYHQTVQKFLPTELVYQYQRSEIEDVALGNLVKNFSRMNSNTVLIDKLRKIKQVRDQLAHKALTKLYGPEKETFDFLENTDKFIDTAAELGLIIDEILKEHKKLLVIKKI
jgi:hypothetical protein